jgi:hypothetical protein
MVDPDPGPAPNVPSPTPDRPPQSHPRIGGFEILDKIGHGGMGAVYKARQVSLDRIVALKILPPRLAKNPEFVQRFLREARSAGRLRHLNIVGGIDAGEADGTCYFAMEFVEGESLGAVLKREKRLPESRAIEIALQIAEGLTHAHAHAMIHRDVKPENILIARDGVAKLCDLGLARSTAADNPSLTQDGTALGTPFYLSPEQARGLKDLDGRTDLYALGATLFHLVAGRPVFQGETAPAIMCQHITEPPPDLAAVAPGVSAGLASVVGLCLEKDPDARYRSMGDLIEDLKLVRDGKAPAIAKARPPARPVRRARREAANGGRRHPKPAGARAPNPLAWAGLGAAGVLAAAGLGFLVLSGGKGPTTPGSGRKPSRSSAVPERPPAPPVRPPAPSPASAAPPAATSDLPARIERAEREFRNAGDDLRGALASFRKLETKARGTAHERRVASILAEITRKREEAARAVERDLAAAAGALSDADDFDGAIATWQKPNPPLADLLGPAVREAVADLHAKAGDRIRAATDEAARLRASGKPDEALRALDAVRNVKYAAEAPALAALRAELGKESAASAAKARQAAISTAAAAFSRHADAFIAATMQGDFDAATRIAEKAKGDAALEAVADSVTALADVADAIRRAEKGFRAALAALRGCPPREFETAKDTVRGAVLNVTDDSVALRCEITVNGVRTPYETSIRIADLAPAVVRRLPGDFSPSTPAEHLAQAARALARRDAGWAAEELAAAGSHPLAMPYRLKLDALRSRTAEDAARVAWEALVREAGTGRLPPARARTVRDRIEAFERDHGSTQHAASVQEDLAALKDRIQAAGGGWKPIPLSALSVQCLGTATAAMAGEVLTVRTPAGQGNRAVVPLLRHARDFRLRFEYRGDPLEMFLRRTIWHGRINLFASPAGVVARTYAVDDPQQQVPLAHDKQASVSASSWHRVEIAVIGASLSFAIDGVAFCRDARLPAVARGNAEILAWPGQAGGTLEIRRASVAVLDKQTDAGMAEGIVTDKGPDWLELKEDGEDVPLRYVPLAPGGGAPDPAMIKTIKGVITLNRARCTWRLDGSRLRLVAIQVLKPPQAAGSIVGTITFKQKACIEITPATGPPERLIPHWRGGMPSQGGGPDPKMVAELAKYGVGDRVKVDWVYDDRKRLVGIAPAP